MSWSKGSILCVGLLVSPRVSAAPVTPSQQELTLFLGVWQDGIASEGRSRQLLNRLGPKERLVDAAHMLSTDRQCRESGCLRQLASRTEATMVLWGTMRHNDQLCMASLTLFHVSSGQFFVRPGICGALDRNPSNRDPLLGLALEAFSAYRATTLVKPLTTIPNWEMVCNVRLPGAPSWRSALAGVFGTLAVLSLGGAIALHALNHQNVAGGCEPYGPGNNRCVASYDVLFGTGYAIAAVTTLGTGLALGLR